MKRIFFSFLWITEQISVDVLGKESDSEPKAVQKDESPRLWREPYTGQSETTDTFLDLLRARSFIDHSLFIEYFVQQECNLVVTAPRRFGKSVNEDMLNTFLNIKNRWNISAPEKTKAYRAFYENKLKIFTHRQRFFDQHFGRYPIIRFNFNHLSVSSWESFLWSICWLLWIEFHSQMQKIKSYGGDVSLLERTLHDIDKMYETKDYDFDTLRNKAKSLTKHLYNFYKERVIFLVDEYHLPMTTASFEGRFYQTIENTTVGDKITEKIGEFLGGILNENQYVRCALLTGTRRVGDVYTQGINNLKYSRIFEDATVSSYLGFTENDVRTLLVRYSNPTPFSVVADFYDGYRVKGHPDKVFCPESVLIFLEHRQLMRYWSSEGIDDMRGIYGYDRMGPFCEMLLESEQIEVQTQEYLSKKQFLVLEKIRSGAINKQNIQPEDENILKQYLVEVGFLAYRSPYDPSMKIVNKEVRFQLEDYIYQPDYLNKRSRITINDIISFGNSLVNLRSDADYVYLLTRIGVLFDKFKIKNEGNMHLLFFSARAAVVGISRKNRDPFSFKAHEEYVSTKLSDNSTASGNIDLIVTTGSGLGIIFEYKFGSSRKCESPEKAMEELERNRYETRLIELNRRYKNFGVHRVMDTFVFIGLHYNDKENKVTMYHTAIPARKEAGELKSPVSRKWIYLNNPNNVTCSSDTTMTDIKEWLNSDGRGATKEAATYASAGIEK